MKWFWIILALVYIVSPYDLIPDFIPVRGWIDDIVVFFLLMRYLRRIRRASPTKDQTAGEQPHDDASRHDRTSDHSQRGETPKDPYTVLGVAQGADQAEIRAAFRRLANQYHPDKVAHLGREFQELAEIRFKEIQNAYDRLRRRR
jgi:DnaJ-domain-containing protein 1